MEKNTQTLPLLVDANYVSEDLGVSRSKAYSIIRQLNNTLKKSHPNTIIVTGRVNRLWYQETFQVGNSIR